MILLDLIFSLFVNTLPCMLIKSGQYHSVNQSFEREHIPLEIFYEIEGFYEIRANAYRPDEIFKSFKCSWLH